MHHALSCSKNSVVTEPYEYECHHEVLYKIGFSSKHEPFARKSFIIAERGCKGETKAISIEKTNSKNNPQPQLDFEALWFLDNVALMLLGEFAAKQLDATFTSALSSTIQLKDIILQIVSRLEKPRFYFSSDQRCI